MIVWAGTKSIDRKIFQAKGNLMHKNEGSKMLSRRFAARPGLGSRAHANANELQVDVTIAVARPLITIRLPSRKKHLSGAEITCLLASGV
jgi:hypothetical protein